MDEKTLKTQKNSNPGDVVKTGNPNPNLIFRLYTIEVNKSQLQASNFKLKIIAFENQHNT